MPTVTVMGGSPEQSSWASYSLLSAIKKEKTLILQYDSDNRREHGDDCANEFGAFALTVSSAGQIGFHPKESRGHGLQASLGALR
jgi:hypothetical protein